MHETLFNLHDVMQLMTAALSIMLALPMALKRRRHLADLLLSGFVLTQGIAALFYVLLYSPTLMAWSSETFGIFGFFPVIVLYALQGPLLLYYSHAISGQPVSVDPADKQVFAFLVGFALLEGVVRTLFFPDHEFALAMVGWGMPALIASVYYAIRALGVLREHNEAIQQRFSNIDDISLLWLSYAAFGFSGIWILRLAAYFPMNIFGYHWQDLAGAAANYPTSLLIAIMVILGLSQQRAVSVAPVEPQPTPGNGSERINPQQIEKLEHLMEAVKIYEDPDLDVDGLADSMGMSARSLSSLINGHYNKNFYEFVNHYRATEAKRLLRDQEHEGLTIQQVFEKAGFASKSTFNTFFKKATGQTPSEYRRSAAASAASRRVS